MEIIVTTISVILLGMLLLSPIFLLRYLNRTKSKHNFLLYLTMSVFLTAFIVFLLAWWGHTSNRLLLSHYGYNVVGASATEYYEHVAPENLERVKALMRSRMGIGWPLKAIITYVYYSPYLLIVYLASYLIGRYRRRGHLDSIQRPN